VRGVGHELKTLLTMTVILYAARTRFIPDTILEDFEQFAWPPAVRESGNKSIPIGKPVDIGSRLKRMWR
jgi:DNA helicase II / ATP-dependent DNA helicase PcrA